MRHVIRQIFRGAQTLPGVGSHPGNQPLIMFVMFGIAAGINSGLIGMIVHAVFMLTGLLPLYMWGCYNRAETSDKMTGNK